MLQNFEVIEPLFEGQNHERIQFKLTIEGNDYRGLFHDNEVQWFQPHPQHKIGIYDEEIVEANVRNLIDDYRSIN